MEMKILSEDNIDKLNDFIEKLNKVNAIREEMYYPNYPFETVHIEDVFKSKDVFVISVEIDGVMVGGLVLRYISKNNIKTAQISCVWVLSDYQNKGIATSLLKWTENKLTEENVKLIELNVASINASALHLYRKLGFKSLSVSANLPKTFYMIRMYKELSGYSLPKFKRAKTYLRSYIIFKLLFKKDSSYNWIYKNMYEKIYLKLKK